MASKEKQDWSRMGWVGDMVKREEAGAGRQEPGQGSKELGQHLHCGSTSARPESRGHRGLLPRAKIEGIMSREGLR